MRAGKPGSTKRTGSRFGVVAIGGVLVLALCGCQTSAQEPTGLSTDPPGRRPARPLVVQSPTGLPTRRTFLNHFRPSLSHIWWTLSRVSSSCPSRSLEPPANATDQEAAVVEAVGRFMASWTAILFGAGVENSRIEQTAAGSQLESLVDYAAESDRLERVIVGEPMRLRLLGVDVVDTAAEADICLQMDGWVELTDGSAELMPSTERYVVSMARSGSDWLASSTQQQDPAECA
jgi:hypothetical protein